MPITVIYIYRILGVRFSVSAFKFRLDWKPMKISGITEFFFCAGCWVYCAQVNRRCRTTTVYMFRLRRPMVRWICHWQCQCASSPRHWQEWQETQISSTCCQMIRENSWFNWNSHAYTLTLAFSFERCDLLAFNIKKKQLDFCISCQTRIQLWTQVSISAQILSYTRGAQARGSNVRWRMVCRQLL